MNNSPSLEAQRQHQPLLTPKQKVVRTLDSAALGHKLRKIRSLRDTRLPFPIAANPFDSTMCVCVCVCVVRCLDLRHIMMFYEACKNFFRKQNRHCHINVVPFPFFSRYLPCDLLSVAAHFSIYHVGIYILNRFCDCHVSLLVAGLEMGTTGPQTPLATGGRDGLHVLWSSNVQALRECIRKPDSTPFLFRRDENQKFFRSISALWKPIFWICWKLFL